MLTVKIVFEAPRKMVLAVPEELLVRSMSARSLMLQQMHLIDLLYQHSHEVKILDKHVIKQT
jgi:hypothetical protein